jgi:hypothetical protein
MFYCKYDIIVFLAEPFWLIQVTYDQNPAFLDSDPVFFISGSGLGFKHPDSTCAGCIPVPVQVNMPIVPWP